MRFLLSRPSGGWRLNRQLAWRFPEWWAVAVSILAWFDILLRSAAMTPALHASHQHVAFSWTADAFDWLLMCAAMMFPLLVGEIRTTATRSLWSRRDRAVAAFLGGYLVPWLLFGGLTAIILRVLQENGNYRRAALVVSVGAVLWQTTPHRRRALVSCHRTMPLSPQGWRADLDCVRYGCNTGGQCLITCWALMLACALCGHNVAAMACSGGAAFVERYKRRPNEYLVRALMAGPAMVSSVLLWRNPYGA